MILRTYFALLDEEDLSTIIEEILPLESRYYNLGRSLNLKIADLRKIRDKHPSDSDGLEDVLLLWLNQKYNEKKYGPPTWRMLVEAVSKESGGDNHELAKKIAVNHPAGRRLIIFGLHEVYACMKININDFQDNTFQMMLATWNCFGVRVLFIIK